MNWSWTRPTTKYLASAEFRLINYVIKFTGLGSYPSESNSFQISFKSVKSFVSWFRTDPHRQCFTFICHITLNRKGK